MASRRVIMHRRALHARRGKTLNAQRVRVRTPAAVLDARRRATAAVTSLRVTPFSSRLRRRRPPAQAAAAEAVCTGGHADPIGILLPLGMLCSAVAAFRAASRTTPRRSARRACSARCRSTARTSTRICRSRWSARRARTSAPLTGDATALLALVSYIDLVYIDLTTGIGPCLRPA